MAWAGSRSHVIVSIVLFVLDILLAGLLILRWSWQSSAIECSSIMAFSAWSLVLPLIVIAPIVIGVLALVRKQSRLFSRIALYAFILMCVSLPFFLAGGGGRCVPPDSVARRKMSEIQLELKEYRDTNGSYPVSLTGAMRQDASPFGITYQKTATSYEVCTMLRKEYLYGFQTNTGEQFCVDDQHPAFGN